MQRSSSSAALRHTASEILGGPGAQAGIDGSPLPAVPKYLSVNSLTKRRKLPKSTGNLHAYMAEDYRRLNWPLPKMYGQEKYGYSLVDVEVKDRAASRDQRFVKEISVMSKKLVRLQYDFQIVDNEWRKTYKALLDAEHRMETCGINAAQQTKTAFKKEVDGIMKQLLQLQEQRDMYETSIKDTYQRCDEIKGKIKTEAELDELREFMETQTKDKIHEDAAFWRTKFNIRSLTNQKRESASGM